MRGTPYSVLASNETTKLTLSSPVAATTIWALERFASSSTSGSHASPKTVSAPDFFALAIAAGSSSITVTL